MVGELPGRDGSRSLTRRRPGRRTFLIFGATVVVVIVATLGITSLTTANQERACQSEYQNVQAALDAYMADNNVLTVPASRGTYDMTAPILLHASNPTAANPNYVRNSQTQWSYAWDTTGRITTILAKPGGPGVPSDCAISSP